MCRLGVLIQNEDKGRKPSFFWTFFRSILRSNVKNQTWRIVETKLGGKTPLP